MRKDRCGTCGLYDDGHLHAVLSGVAEEGGGSGYAVSAQYALIWSRVDLARKLITIPTSKNGNTRHIPLNSVALAAFQELFARSSGQDPVFLICKGSR
jgi:hypothetical protein